MDDMREVTIPRVSRASPYETVLLGMRRCVVKGERDRGATLQQERQELLR